MALATKKPITLPDTEQQQVQALEVLLRSGVPALVSPGGERIELPGTVFEVLGRRSGSCRTARPLRSFQTTK